MCTHLCHVIEGIYPRVIHNTILNSLNIVFFPWNHYRSTILKCSFLFAFNYANHVLGHSSRIIIDSVAINIYSMHTYSNIYINWAVQNM